MFPILAIVCFLLALFGASVGLDLVVLGLVFVAATLLVGDWPLGGRLRR